MLVDAGDVIAHVFRPEPRTFYQLEKMWGWRTTPRRAQAQPPTARARRRGRRVNWADDRRHRPRRPGPERELYEQYAGRIAWPLALREVEEKKKLPPAELMGVRASCCWAPARQGAALVALDRRGKTLDSEAFARRLAGGATTAWPMSPS